MTGGFFPIVHIDWTTLKRLKMVLWVCDILEFCFCVWYRKTSICPKYWYRKLFANSMPWFSHSTIQEERRNATIISQSTDDFDTTTCYVTVIRSLPPQRTFAKKNRPQTHWAATRRGFNRARNSSGDRTETRDEFHDCAVKKVQWVNPFLWTQVVVKNCEVNVDRKILGWYCDLTR